MNSTALIYQLLRYLRASAIVIIIQCLSSILLRIQTSICGWPRNESTDQQPSGKTGGPMIHSFESSPPASSASTWTSPHKKLAALTILFCHCFIDGKDDDITAFAASPRISCHRQSLASSRSLLLPAAPPLSSKSLPCTTRSPPLSRYCKQLFDCDSYGTAA